MEFEVTFGPAQRLEVDTEDIKLVRGPAGPPGDPPRIGDDGNWWIGTQNTGIPAQGKDAPSDHGRLTGREEPQQHPIEAITGLREALDALPELLNKLAAHETDGNAHPYLVVDGNNTEEAPELKTGRKDVTEYGNH